jgi:ABC-type transporter Mla MlaB component
VGIFSLFGKKDRQQTPSADRNSSRIKHDTNTSGTTDAGKSGRSQTAKRDMQAARATALKIDAIESEMSSEFVKPATRQSGNTRPNPESGTRPAQPKSKIKPATPPSGKPRGSSQKTDLPSLDFAATLPPMGPTTRLLLDSHTTIGITAPSSETAAVIEEAAVMFANNQVELVEQMLLAAIDEDQLGDSTLVAWWMLFDLYQITGKQQDFEHLSIQYASKFETSPPTWAPIGRPETQQTRAAPSGAIPMVSFSGKLDGNIVKLLERVQKLAESHQALRLEFIRVTEVDPVGCGLLLNVLKKLQKSGDDLVLVGAPELAGKIRAILQVGQRDETEDSWLLLLEILRLLNLEREFEETSMDYCITFEVSPPAFVPPKNKVTTAAAEQSQASAEPDAFMMPAVIEGRIDPLILGIASYSEEHNPAIIDCSRLTRIDFNAAGRLLTGLAPFCSNDRAIEFHNVNHLVAALFSVMGLKDLVRVLSRKQ